MIAVGTAHTVALSATNGLVGFGDNREGQLGLPASPTGWPEPRSIGAGIANPAATVRGLAAGSCFTLAWLIGDCTEGREGREGGGEVWVCGESQAERRIRLPKPVVAIAGGTSHCIAVCCSADDAGRSGGRGGAGALVAYAWGKNQYGQLGLGPEATESEAEPTPTLPLHPGSSVRRIACGAGTILAVTEAGTKYVFI